MMVAHMPLGLLDHGILRALAMVSAALWVTTAADPDSASAVSRLLRIQGLAPSLHSLGGTAEVEVPPRLESLAPPRNVTKGQIASTPGAAEAEEFKLPEWAVPVLAAGGLVLLVCQVCAIGYVYAYHRARHEGRTFWYRGSASAIVDSVGCCDCWPSQMTSIMEGEVQHDLRLGRAYWTGQWGKDYRFRVANFHPLFSIFYCHPLHPYSKAARILVFAITLAFMVGWRSVIEEQIKDEKLLWKDWDRDIAPGFYAVRKLYHINCYGQMALFAYVTLPSMVAEFLFAKLAMLHDSISDFHREYRDNSCCTTCAASFLTFAGWVACILFYLCAGASLGIFLFVVQKVSEVEGRSEEFFYYSVIIPQSLAQIWLVWWFLFDLFCPYFGFGLCHFFKGRLCFEVLCWQWWVEEQAVEKEPTWRVADTAHAKFGLEVSDDAFEDEGAAIVREDVGLIRDRNTWVAVELVPQAQLETWVSSKMVGAEKGQDVLQELQAQKAHSARLRNEECAQLVECCVGKNHSRLLRCGAKCGPAGWFLNINDRDGVDGSR